MRNIVLISHGRLSEGMAYSAQMVAGEKANISYYGLMPGGLVEDMIEKVKVTAEADPENQYLVISDVLGGSVCNGSIALQDLPNVKLATGMNLLMVIQLLFSDEDMTDNEFAAAVNSSIDSIKVISKVEGSKDSPDDFF